MFQTNMNKKKDTVPTSWYLNIGPQMPYLNITDLFTYTHDEAWITCHKTEKQ